MKNKGLDSMHGPENCDGPIVKSYEILKMQHCVLEFMKLQNNKALLISANYEQVLCVDVMFLLTFVSHTVYCPYVNISLENMANIS